jgi:hypothetical protein
MNIESLIAVDALAQTPYVGRGDGVGELAVGAF